MAAAIISMPECADSEIMPSEPVKIPVRSLKNCDASRGDDGKERRVSLGRVTRGGGLRGIGSRHGRVRHG